MEAKDPDAEGLLRGFPIALARIATTGHVVATNPKWDAWLGAAPLADRLSNKDREALSAALAEGVAKTLELRLVGGVVKLSCWPAGGGVMWVLAEPSRDEDAERKARILVDCFQVLDAIIWSCDPEGKILVSEGNGLRLLGIAPGQFVGGNVHDLFPSDSPAIDIVRRTLSGETLTYEDVTEKAHWLNVYTPLRDEAGAVLGLESVAVNFDHDLQLAKRAKAIANCVDRLPIAISAIDKQGVCTVVAGALAESLGFSSEALVGKSFFERFQDRPELVDDFKRALSGEHLVVERSFGDRFTRSRYAPLHGRFGDIIGACVAIEDATEQRLVEERLREHIALVESQKRAIAELGTPIIEVWQDILAVPVVGTIDEARAELMLAELLDKIVTRGARFAILDVTGVDAVDTATAQHLVKVVEASKLLGCEGVITGIRPSVASTLVELGADLSKIRTLRSLKDALRSCATRSSRRGLETTS